MTQSDKTCSYCFGNCSCPQVTVIPSAPDDPSLKCERAFESITEPDSPYRAKRSDKQNYRN